MTSNHQIRKAKKRVNAKKGFYFHLASYVIVNGFLMIINMLTDTEPWFIYPLASWGVALAFHYVGVFGIPGLGVLSKDWEDQEMEKELRRLGVHDEELEIPRPRQKSKRLDMDEHLDLKELRKNYDDSEFV